MEDSEIRVDGATPLQLSDEVVDEYHTSDPSLIKALIEDKNQPKPLRAFARDFLLNGQEFDNISFLESRYVRDESVFNDVQFLLPGDSYIWHMNYEGLEKNRHVIMEPIPVRAYFKEFERSLIEFFSNSNA